MRWRWTGVVGCSFLAWLGAFACGATRHDEPVAASGAPADPADASNAGASASGAAGQGDRVSLGGGPSLTPGPSAGAGSSSQEPAVEPHSAVACANPEPFELGGGYVVCEDKSLRIGARSACPSILPRQEPTEPLFYQDCALDVDCTASAHGFCAYGQCQYGCVSDDECDPGQLCFCGAEIGKCVNADCRSDADCAAGYPCTGNQPYGTDTASFRCQTPLDTCQSDYDCPGPRMHCWIDEQGHRSCQRDPVG